MAKKKTTTDGNNDKKLIFQVTFKDSTNSYFVDIAKGASVEETIFAMAVALRCLVRDNIIQNTDDAEKLLHKYLTDSQYDPVQ